MRSRRRLRAIAALAAVLTAHCASRPWYERAPSRAGTKAPAKAHRPEALRRKPCGRQPLASDAWAAVVRIQAGAKSYFQADHYDRNGNLLAKRFPPPRNTTVAFRDKRYDSGWTDPCRLGRARWRAQWNKTVWRSLQFQPRRCDDTRFRFESWGKNLKAAYKLRVRAYRPGVSACRYTFTGSVDNEFGVVTHEPAHARPSDGASRPTTQPSRALRP